MAMTWYKLHHEIIDDIKIRRFTPQEKWAWIVLLSLASKSSDRGFIVADNDDLADYCEFSCIQDWLYYRDKLIAKGMIEIAATGNLAICHWKDRQSGKPSDSPERIKERVAKSRAKKKNEAIQASQDDVTRYIHDVTPSNENVTPQTRLDQIRSEEIRKDKIRLEEKKINSESEIFIDQDQEPDWDLLKEQSDRQTDQDLLAQDQKSDPNLALSETENLALIPESSDLDPTLKEIPPTPLSAAPTVAAVAAVNNRAMPKDPMGDRLRAGNNKFIPKQLYGSGFESWHGGTKYNDWKPSLIAATIQYLRKHKLPCEVANAQSALSNYCKTEQWDKFAIMVEKAEQETELAKRIKAADDAIQPKYQIEQGEQPKKLDLLALVKERINNKSSKNTESANV
jgi:hypothetical protein